MRQLTDVDTIAYDHAVRWFLNHSVRAWVSRCSSEGVHNRSSRQFTFDQLYFLANNFNFITTPRTPLADQQKDVRNGCSRFVASLKQQIAFADAEDDDDFDAKFRIKRKHNPNASAFIEHKLDDKVEYHERMLVERYVTATQSNIERALSSPLLATAVKGAKLNFRPRDLAAVRSLANDASIIVAQTDKNLGLVVLDSEWYHATALTMLSDSKTYQVVAKTPGKLEQLVFDIGNNLSQLVAKQGAWLSDQMQTFLRQRVNLQNADVPIFYLLAKIHKPVMSARPIVPSLNWITTPASIVADHFLGPLRRHIPWLVRDTKTLINQLETQDGAVTRCHDGVLLSADIASLYTNIDTALGLRQVQRFLAEFSNWPLYQQMFVMELLTIVMENSYLQYDGVVYKQVDGTAMGTNVAPPYADIVVFMLERDNVERYRRSGALLMYFRYLDDLLMYVKAAKVSEIAQAWNAMHPKLTFAFSQDNNSIAFLDLVIYKGPRFFSSGRFDVKLHQKRMNRYLYIPYRSYHTRASKASWIYTELTRYIRNNSDFANYVEVKSLFFDRLCDRGYPAAFLHPIFDGVSYSDRCYFLANRTMRIMDAIRSHGWSPPTSSFLQRRLRQELRAENRSINGGASRITPFVCYHSPLTQHLDLRQLLMKEWESISHLRAGRPLIAYRNPTKIGSWLVCARRKSNKVRKLDKKWRPPRKTGGTLIRDEKNKAAARQTASITSFFPKSRK